MANYKTFKFWTPINTLTIDPTSDLNPTHTEFSIFYTQGGTSFYDYKKITQGIKLSIDNVERKEHCTKSIMGTSLSFTLMETKRYNEKKLTEIKELIKPHIKTIAELWNNNKPEEIKTLLDSIMKV